MVILDHNPLEISAADISEIKVLTTLLSGEVIYDVPSSLGLVQNPERYRYLAYSKFKASGHPCSLHVH